MSAAAGPDLPAGYRLAAMCEEDVEEVARVERASFPSPWLAASFRHEVQRNPYARSYVVRDAAGRLAAYASVWTIDDQVLINNLAVAAEHRRRGLGGALLRHLLRVGREAGCREALLEVRPSNGPALRLYLRHGFRHAAIRRRYYSDGEDAWVLLRGIDRPADPP
jgi:ribosomal-protein-alanine N-acetyltransferase